VIYAFFNIKNKMKVVIPMASEEQQFIDKESELNID